MNMEINKDEIIGLIEENRDAYIDVSSRIWDYAETCFKEYKSSEALADLL